jgi:glycosyltransferase involved in cell wall biosynthesis
LLIPVRCTREGCEASRHVLVWAAHDGIETQTSGIAVLTSYFAHDAARLRARLAGPNRSSSATYIAYPTTGRPPLLPRDTSAHGVATGLLPLASPVPDGNPFGSPTAWGSWCDQLARWARRIESGATHVIIIANDSPFFGMAGALLAVGARRTDCVTVVHSSARIWDPMLGSAEERHRDEWENRGLEVAVSHRTPVIAVSPYVQSRLIADFTLPSTAITVHPPRHSVSALTALLAGRVEADAWLDAEGVPSGARVVLWSGRDVASKAPDIARGALAALTESSSSVHGLMFLRDDLSRLHRRGGQVGRDRQFRIYHEFPFGLPRQLLATARVQCVLVSSRSEPHGLIPEESVILSTLAGTTIIPAVARVDGLGDQEGLLRDGVEFYVDPENASDAAAAISRALSRAGTGTPGVGQVMAYRRIRAAGTFIDWIFTLLGQVLTGDNS